MNQAVSHVATRRAFRGIIQNERLLQEGGWDKALLGGKKERIIFRLEHLLEGKEVARVLS